MPLRYETDLHEKLFRYFDFQLVNPAKPWKSEVWTVWVEKDYMVQVTETSPSEK